MKTNYLLNFLTAFLFAGSSLQASSIVQTKNFNRSNSDLPEYVNAGKDEECFTPLIMLQPSSIEICENNPVTFNINALGTSLSFQWQDSSSTHGWRDIPGANSTTYSIENVTPENSGTNFKCVVSWDCGILSSDIILLTVNPSPMVNIINPASVCYPATIDLTAPLLTTGSTPGLSYSYFRDPAATLPVASPQAVSEAGTYLIVGTSPIGCSDTSSVIVTVNPSFIVNIINPAPVCYPATIDLTSPLLTSGSTPGQSYSYFMDPAATLPVASPQAVSEEGTYFIVGTSPIGCSDTSSVIITINLPLITGDINCNSIIDDFEISGDKNSDGLINNSEIAGDINGNGVIDIDEIAGDINGNRIINAGEIAGDLNGNGIIDGNKNEGDINANVIANFKISSDKNSDSFNSEVAGDINGNGLIDIDEIAGDINGNRIINADEIAGDLNGNRIIDGNEIEGDANGNGIIDGGEVVAGISKYESERVRLYPNPTQNYLFIKEGKEIKSLTIYNTHGTELMTSSNLKSERIDLSEFENGVYIIKIEIEGNTFFERIVVAK
jgi:hypothetical protein